MESGSCTFEPLEITVMLGSPVMLTYPWIMLDSLVMHLYIEKYKPSLLDSISPRDPVDLSWLPIPIEKIEHAGTYIYNCSCSRFDGDVNSTTHVRKRINEPDLDHLETRKRNIDTVRGMFKAYDMTMITKISPRCTFHAMGDHDALQDLLSGLQSLGKKRAIGYGKVIGVDVKPVRENWSIHHPEFGLNRPVPVSFKDKLGIVGDIVPVAFLCNRPPYWSKRGVEPSIPPGGFE